MRYLMEFSQREDVRSIVNAALKYKSVQGIVLEIDRFWLNSWRMKDYLGSKRYMDLDNGYGLSLFDFGYDFFGMNTERFLLSRKIELSDVKTWKPQGWDEYCESLNLKEIPIIVKICLLPQPNGSENPLPEIPNTELNVVFETRPRATLYSSPKKIRRPLVGGVSISSSSLGFGTLGGILKDDLGEKFGLTCSHVIDSQLNINQPAQIDSRNSSLVGKCVNKTNLISNNLPGMCNPYSNNPINTVDAGLIQFDAGIDADMKILDIGPINEITSIANMSVFQDIEIMSRTSGHSRYIVGGLALAYEFEHDNQYYCFKNMFEIRSQGRLKTILSSPIKPGDSGAWVCTPANDGVGWCGMVVGCDRWQGFAIFSETIVDWLTNQGRNLSVV